VRIQSPLRLRQNWRTTGRGVLEREEGKWRGKRGEREGKGEGQERGRGRDVI